MRALTRPAPPSLPVCRLDELPPGLGRAFHVGGTSLAVFRTRAGRVFAVDRHCPHRGGSLADGMLVGGQVVCPLHAQRFDLSTGECDQAAACGITSYPVAVRDGVVHLAVEQG